MVITDTSTNPSIINEHDRKLRALMTYVTSEGPDQPAHLRISSGPSLSSYRIF